MCVSHSVSKGFPFKCFQQGGREDLQGSAQRSSLQDPRKRKLITSVYLLVTLPHFSLRCFGAMVVDHDTFPSNRFPSALQPLIAAFT